MDTQELGMHIRKARMEKQMKQAELASQLSVSPTTLCKWEKGINRPDIESLKALSAILGIPLMALLGESTPEPESPLPDPVPQPVPPKQKKAGKPWTRRLAISVVCLLLAGTGLCAWICTRLFPAQPEFVLREEYYGTYREHRAYCLVVTYTGDIDGYTAWENPDFPLNLYENSIRENYSDYFKQVEWLVIAYYSDEDAYSGDKGFERADYIGVLLPEPVPTLETQ